MQPSQSLRSIQRGQEFSLAVQRELQPAVGTVFGISCLLTDWLRGQPGAQTAKPAEHQPTLPWRRTGAIQWRLRWLLLLRHQPDSEHRNLKLQLSAGDLPHHELARTYIAGWLYLEPQPG